MGEYANSLALWVLGICDGFVVMEDRGNVGFGAFKGRRFANIGGRYRHSCRS